MYKVLKKEHFSYYLIWILFFIALVFYIFLGEFPVGRFGDISPRISDSIENATWNSLKEKFTSFNHWIIQLHPPLDSFLRIVPSAIGYHIFSLTNQDLIFLHKLLSTFYTCLSLFILSLTFNNTYKKSASIALIILGLNSTPLMYGFFYSMTESLALVCCSLSYFFFLKNKVSFSCISAIFLALGTMIRPEVILLIPAFALILLLSKRFQELIFFSLISSSFVVLRNLFKIFWAPSERHYFNFSSHYKLPDFSFSNSIEILNTKKVLLPFSISSTFSFILILITVITLITKMIKKKSFTFTPQIYLFLLSLIYLTLLLVGYNFKIGRPETRNIIYYSLFSSLFFTYAIFQFSKLAKYSALIGLLIISAFNIPDVIGTINKENRFEKKHNLNVKEILKTINKNDSIALDYLHFNEWIIRSNLVQPGQGQKICSFDRCSLQDNKVSISKKVEKLAVNLKTRHFFFSTNIYNFVITTRPTWIISLKKEFFDLFFNKYQKSTKHISLVHHLVNKNPSEEILTIIDAPQSLSYQFTGSTNRYNIYRKME